MILEIHQLPQWTERWQLEPGNSSLSGRSISICSCQLFTFCLLTHLYFQLGPGRVLIIVVVSVDVHKIKMAAPCISLPPELTESLGDQSYITKAEYTAQLEDEVSFPKHVMVDVIEKSTTGWWTIR